MIYMFELEYYFKMAKEAKEKGQLDELIKKLVEDGVLKRVKAGIPDTKMYAFNVADLDDPDVRFTPFLSVDTMTGALELCDGYELMTIV